MSATLDGVLIVDKAAGMTSHDVVAAIRRRLPRGVKVGHTGTLDPFATGVLPIVVGKATRLSQFLTSSRKQYMATVGFGTATDTGDVTGAVVAVADAGTLGGLDAVRVAAACSTLVGTHPQVPPAHSAKKVDGERAYDLARRGRPVELPAVAVTAYDIELMRWDAPQAVVRLTTAAGYYVRSFARDLGTRLGVPAHLTALRRIASGEFDIGRAQGLEGLLADEQLLEGALLPMATLLQELPAVVVGEDDVQGIRQGRPIRPGAVPTDLAGDRRVRVVSADALVALARAVPGRPDLLHADIVLV